MVLVKPATVVQWHRKGFRLYWRWRSRRPGRPKIGAEIRDLICRMSKANPLWGAPRIHGELLKLGINHGLRDLLHRHEVLRRRLRSDSRAVLNDGVSAVLRLRL
jgi:hypothetical protein